MLKTGKMPSSKTNNCPKKGGLASLQQGFSLIELMAVIVIIGLMIGVVGPKFNGMLRGNLRTGSSKLAGFMKSAYERSVMRGEHIRVFFDLENNTYWASLYQAPLTSPLVTESDKIDDVIMAFEKKELDAQDEDPDKKQQAQEFEAIGSGTLKKKKFPQGIRVKSIYKSTTAKKGLFASPNDDDGGILSMDFYPNGFTTQSIIYLENEYEDIYSIIVSPIGGQTRIEKGEFSPELL